MGIAKRIFSLLIMVMAIMVAIGNSGWAIPQMIAFSGRLTGADGRPITTKVDLTFSFWDAETGGNMLPRTAIPGGGWTEAISVTPNSNGIFNVILGAKKSIDASVFTGDSVYLQVVVDNKVTLSRQRLVSVPYAFRAARADSAAVADRAVMGGGWIEDQVGKKAYTSSTDYSVGIGTTDPKTALEVNGTVKAKKFEGDGSGLTNLPGGLWTQSGKDIYYTTGNVGIGTQEPKVALKVVGSFESGYNATASGFYSAALGYNATASGYRSIALGAFTSASGSNSVAMGYNVISNGDRSSAFGSKIEVLGKGSVGIGLDPDITARPVVSLPNTMVVMGGNVGIGKLDPQEKLEVDGVVKATKFIGDGSELSGLTRSQWITSGSDIYYNLGKVGIGTVAPLVPLHVEGVVRTTGTLEFGGIGETFPNLRKAMTGSGNYGLSVDYNRIQKAYIDRLGNAGFSALKIGSNYAWNNVLPSQNSLLVEGSLGIGLLAPTEKLDVSGDIRIIGKDGYDQSGERAKIFLGDKKAGIVAEYGYGLKFGVYQPGGNGAVGSDSVDAMVIKEVNGRVGIGTLSPEANLNVVSRINTSPAIFCENPGAQLMSSSDDGPALKVGSGWIEISRVNGFADKGNKPTAENIIMDTISGVVYFYEGYTQVKIINQYVKSNSIIFVQVLNDWAQNDAKAHFYASVDAIENGYFYLKLNQDPANNVNRNKRVDVAFLVIN